MGATLNWHMFDLLVRGTRAICLGKDAVESATPDEFIADSIAHNST